MKKLIIITFLLQMLNSSIGYTYTNPPELKFWRLTAQTDTTHLQEERDIFTVNLLHWDTATLTWYRNVTDAKYHTGNSLNISIADNAISDAFAEWKKGSAGYSKNTASVAAEYAPDGKNVIFWTDDDDMLNALDMNNEDTTACTIITNKGGNDIDEFYDADIIFNAKYMYWTDDWSEVDFYANPKIADIQSIATHEIGHMLGFAHNSITGSVMKPSYAYDPGCAWRTISADDEFGVLYLRDGVISENISQLVGGQFWFNWDITIDSTVTFTSINPVCFFEQGHGLFIEGTLECASKQTFTYLGTSGWSGITIQSGGSLNVGDELIISEATTGIHTYGSSPISISSGDSLTIKNCSIAGLHIHSSTPTIQYVHIDSVTTGYGGIVVEGSTTNPTIRDCTLASNLYGVYIASYADANLFSDYMYSNSSDCIYLNTAAEINMEDASGGYNSIIPTGNNRAIFNNSTNGTIYADYNYWGTANPQSTLFGDANYVDDYTVNLSTHPATAGVQKPASSVYLSQLQQAMQYESMGSYDIAYGMYNDILHGSTDPQIKRRSLKFMLGIKEKSDHNYKDLLSIVSREQSEYKKQDSYRAILDYIACELKNREGNKSEAIEAFHNMASVYIDTPMEVEMLCRIAELYGDLGNSDQALEYANRAAAINPGQSTLMTAYAAAGQKYNPLEYTDRYKNWDGVYKDSDDPDTELAETATPSITITPNPANPATTLHYTIVQPGNVKLSVYNASGQKVATLVNDYMSAGKHSVVFDGSNLASGVYFYRLESKGFAKSGKMLLIK